MTEYSQRFVTQRLDASCLNAASSGQSSTVNAALTGGDRFQVGIELDVLSDKTLCINRSLQIAQMTRNMMCLCAQHDVILPAIVLCCSVPWMLSNMRVPRLDVWVMPLLTVPGPTGNVVYAVCVYCCTVCLVSSPAAYPEDACVSLGLSFCGLRHDSTIN